MKRTLMISDIHGCLEPFERLLEEIRYDPGRDRLVLLGDYVDRGPRSRDVVDKVMDLVERHGAVALRGNHDQRLVDLIRTNDSYVRSKFMEHGGKRTIFSYCGLGRDEMNGDTLSEAISYIERNYGHHIDFLGKLPLYYEDDRHICVHAGLNPAYPNWKEQPARDFMYIKKDFFRSRTKVDRTVVFGHTRAEEIHGAPEVWFQEDKIAIDGGCAYGAQLNCLIYEEGAYSTHAIRNSSSSL